MGHTAPQRFFMGTKLEDRERHAELFSKATKRVSLHTLHEGCIHDYGKTGRNDSSGLLRQMSIGALGDVRGIQIELAATGGALQRGQTVEPFPLHVGADADGAGGLD